MDFSHLSGRGANMKPFDPATMELDGYALVEASAGTGKTYGITSLYLRLIMEEGLQPGQILVVTFTRAATEELLMKIRERLESALNYFKNGKEPENDQFILDLEKRLCRLKISPKDMIQRLQQAILRLDEAAVFTIHGFCQRMLNEFAIEAGVPLEKNVIQSEAELQKDGCRQFCRTILYGLEEKKLRAVEKALGISAANTPLPDALYDKLKRLLIMPGPKILPELTLKQGFKILDERARTIAKLRDLFHEHGTEYREIIQDELGRCIEEFIEPINEFPAISKVMPLDFVKKRMNKECHKLVSEAFDNLLKYDPEKNYEEDELFLSSLLFEQFCSGQFLLKLWNVLVRSKAGDLKHLEKVDKESIGAELARLWDKNYAQSHTLPEEVAGNPFYKALINFWKELKGAEKKFLAGLLSDARRFVHKDVKKKKALLSVISYDDIIKDMHRALRKEPGAKSLQQRIKNRFDAALIDEFQDTDRLQWEIFSAIYPDPEKDRLYLIGDPKQAIYGFRGADIFTYLKAKEVLPPDRHFGLNINWRSNKDLIAATNVIFGRVQNVFVLEGIEYTPVEPKPEGHEWLMIKEEGESSLSVELWGNISDKEDSARFTAWEIARLLSLGKTGKAFIHADGGVSKPLEAGHIAVLIHNFWEAAKIRDELTKLHIPSVFYGKSSIFKTQQAPELLYILNAVSVPSDARAVATALGTVALGFQAGEILKAQKTPEIWDRIVDDFVELKRIWQEQGVLPMLMALFHRFDVPKRLLGLKGGERSLTNLRQLAELLSEAEKELPGVEQLILWLKQNIKGEAGEDDEHQLRLETDENVVRIMTYHRSKGLEFPVVFLPFLDQFERKKEDGAEIYYSKEHDFYVHDCLGQEPVMDDETGESVISQGQKQSDAEVMRLIYVAITRARCRLYLPVSSGRIASLIALDKSQGFDGRGTNYDNGPDNAEDHMDELHRLDELVKKAFKGSDDAEATESTKCDKGSQDKEDREPEDQDNEEYRKEILGRLNDVPGVACLLSHELKKRHEQVDLKKGVFSNIKAPITPPSSITRRPLAPWIWHQLSFSSITALDDTYSDDALSAFLRTSSGIGHEHEHDSMFGFPKGTRAGKCIHALFENIDFGSDQMAIKEEAIRCLLEYDIDERWADILTEMALRVLNTEISPGLRLSQIHPSWISKEMGFYMPVTKVSMQKFQKLFPDMERGIMKGFIDLFFRHEDSCYILDYKNNWLGNDPSDYGQKGMKQAMDEHDYWLQAAIYLKAMEQYLLSNHVGNRAFNVDGIFYLFVRGVGADPDNQGCGIFFIKPDELRSRYPDLFSSKGRRTVR